MQTWCYRRQRQTGSLKTACSDDTAGTSEKYIHRYIDHNARVGKPEDSTRVHM